MELGPQTDVYPCPTCGVDAARAMVVAAVVAFYQPTYQCPECGLSLLSMQSAADHVAQHKPELLKFVQDWIADHEPRYEVRWKSQ